MTYQNGEHIDVDKLVAAVREVAAEQPDFVYPSNYIGPGPACYYTNEEGAPDCIIGRAMAKIGQPLPTQLRDGENECHLLDGPVHTLYWADAMGISDNDERLNWLGRVQAEQDSRATWSKAVRRADEAYTI